MCAKYCLIWNYPPTPHNKKCLVLPCLFIRHIKVKTLPSSRDSSSTRALAQRPNPSPRMIIKITELLCQPRSEGLFNFQHNGNEEKFCERSFHFLPIENSIFDYVNALAIFCSDFLTFLLLNLCLTKYCSNPATEAVPQSVILLKIYREENHTKEY